ncbi:hypothetical protein ACFQ71_41880, partial [Streptomyces sp. NPDC056534]|uniref:hypothetical protein n=1 Tax=Streptomyces sp. NPDC056534 TaxID=3345857 RepID=UPI00367E8352
LLDHHPDCLVLELRTELLALLCHVPSPSIRPIILVGPVSGNFGAAQVGRLLMMAAMVRAWWGSVKISVYLG